MWFSSYIVSVQSELTCGLKKPVSQNWCGRPVLIQLLSCWFLSSSSLNQKPSVADGQLSRSHRRGIRASNMQSRASRRSSDMMMVPVTRKKLCQINCLIVENLHVCMRAVWLTVNGQFEVSERAPYDADDSLHAVHFLSQEDVHWLKWTHLLQLTFDLKNTTSVT